MGQDLPRDDTHRRSIEYSERANDFVNGTDLLGSPHFSARAAGADFCASAYGSYKYKGFAHRKKGRRHSIFQSRTCPASALYGRRILSISRGRAARTNEIPDRTGELAADPRWQPCCVSG